MPTLMHVPILPFVSIFAMDIHVSALKGTTSKMMYVCPTATLTNAIVTHVRTGPLVLTFAKDTSVSVTNHIRCNTETTMGNRTSVVTKTNVKNHPHVQSIPAVPTIASVTHVPAILATIWKTKNVYQTVTLTNAKVTHVPTGPTVLTFVKDTNVNARSLIKCNMVTIMANPISAVMKINVRNPPHVQSIRHVPMIALVTRVHVIPATTWKTINACPTAILTSAKNWVKVCIASTGVQRGRHVLIYAKAMNVNATNHTQPKMENVVTKTNVLMEPRVQISPFAPMNAWDISVNALRVITKTMTYACLTVMRINVIHMGHVQIMLHVPTCAVDISANALTDTTWRTRYACLTAMRTSVPMQMHAPIMLYAPTIATAIPVIALMGIIWKIIFVFLTAMKINVRHLVLARTTLPVPISATDINATALRGITWQTTYACLTVMRTSVPIRIHVLITPFAPICATVTRALVRTGTTWKMTYVYQTATKTSASEIPALLTPIVLISATDLSVHATTDTIWKPLGTVPIAFLTVMRISAPALRLVPNFPFVPIFATDIHVTASMGTIWRMRYVYPTVIWTNVRTIHVRLTPTVPTCATVIRAHATLDIPIMVANAATPINAVAAHMVLAPVRLTQCALTNVTDTNVPVIAGTPWKTGHAVTLTSA